MDDDAACVCVQVTVEEWMRFFNRQWEVAPGSVYSILEAISSVLLC